MPASRVREVYAYEIGTTSRYDAAHLGAFRPNVYVDVTATMEKKLDAMRCYALELREMPHPRSIEGLRIIARERGLAIGVEYAEAFRKVVSQAAELKKMEAEG